MASNFTIFFTFFADGDVRRKYVELAVKPLHEKTDKSFPLLVIDASNKEDSKKNKQLFSGFKNLTFINDTEVNPFVRCKKYLNLIETDFVLRLLEDCVYINLFNDNLIHIKNDVALMQRNSMINVIQYPIINDQNFIVKNNLVFYPKINFEDKKLLTDKGYSFYDRSSERDIYHYLCNNILYRADFFMRHWMYFSSKYIDHNSAESSKPNNQIFKFFFNRKFSWKAGVVFHKWFEKLFHPNEIINNIYVTESMIDSDTIHIGYYSTEKIIGKRDALDNKIDGVSSVLTNLAVFSDMDFLDKIKFKRLDS